MQGGAQEAPRALAGLRLKSVETLGEQSAAGLATRAGVIVLAVDPGSRGDAAGLRPRDVIVGVGKDGPAGFAPVADSASLLRLLARHAGRDIDLTVVRNQARIVLRWRGCGTLPGDTDATHGPGSCTAY